MSFNIKKFIESNAKDVVVSSLLLSLSILLLAISYGRTTRSYDLLSRFAFALLIATLVRLMTVFLYEEKFDESAIKRLGIKTAHEYLSTVEVRRRLKDARNVDVMKTWFPDHPDIRDGLLKTIKNPNAVVRLLLSHPDSALLRERSVGAGQHPNHGLWEVTRTLRDLYTSTKNQPTAAKFEIRLYHGWPGCPTIWCDGQGLLGFYLRGRPSPFWPWLEIKAQSDFDKILRQQFDDLWELAPDRIHDREHLAKWLRDRGELVV